MPIPKNLPDRDKILEEMRKSGVFDTFHAAWKASRFTDEQYARWEEDRQRHDDAKEGFDD